jgi:membrane protease YdiL (CAAX protease family)
MILAGLAFTIAAAFALGLILKAPPLARFSFDIADVVAGLVATAPLVLLLFWFMRTKNRTLASFRESQIDFLAQVGFRFTPLRIATMAIGAGVSEELLFRGVLQTWSDRFLPLAAAIVLTNTLFGALHARTLLYAVIAGFVGAYLGVIFEATENLLTAMVTHAAYDAVALELARRAIEQRQTRMAE